MSIVGDFGAGSATSGAGVTVTQRERRPGEPGPAPDPEHTEIRWATMSGLDVVVKAAGESRRSHVRREAEVLERIAAEASANPAAIEFVELVEGADHTELVTRRHGAVTLAEVGLLSTHERTAALISLCEAVDSLHAGGWAHAALEPAHVVVNTSGTPAVTSNGLSAGVRLCSLGEARQPGASEVAAAQGADRAALTSIVLDTLDRPGGFGTRRERRRYDRQARKARRTLSSRRGLLDGAAIRTILQDTIGRGLAEQGASPTRQTPTDQDRSTGGEPQAGDAGSTVRDRVVRPVSRRPRRWRTASVVAGAVVCAASGAAAARLVTHAPTAQGPPACRVEIGTDEVPCDAVEVDGNIASIGDQRIAVGDVGDELMVGDWDCDGAATAVLLERGTGRLFHFPSWSTGSAEVTGEELGRFQDATGLARAGSCVYPEVELPDGSNISPLSGRGSAAGDPQAHAGGGSGEGEGR